MKLQQILFLFLATTNFNLRPFQRFTVLSSNLREILVLMLRQL